jgi:hypothetical protein
MLASASGYTYKQVRSHSDLYPISCHVSLTDPDVDSSGNLRSRHG